MAQPEPLAVPVDGGTLHGGRWPAPSVEGDAKVAIAAHGITANHLSWAKVARRLADYGTSVAAPDLRGRVQSASLPGPWGLRRHAEDLLAVADQLGQDRGVYVGHSMGAWVVAVLAATWPGRVAALVLVDGGFSVALPDGADPDELLAATLGPALARLGRTYPSRDAYLAEWAAHPAFAGGIDRDVRAYLLADLSGSGFGWRSSVREDAVRTDGRQLLIDEDVRAAVHRLPADLPVTVVRATRGLFDEPNPLVPAELVDPWAASHPTAEVVTVDANHYTLVTGDKGAEAVADAIRGHF